MSQKMIQLKPLKCRDILLNFTFEALALQVPGGHFHIFPWKMQGYIKVWLHTNHASSEPIFSPSKKMCWSCHMFGFEFGAECALSLLGKCRVRVSSKQNPRVAMESLVSSVVSRRCHVMCSSSSSTLPWGSSSSTTSKSPWSIHRVWAAVTPRRLKVRASLFQFVLEEIQWCT